MPKTIELDQSLGTCAECGAELREVESKVVREDWDAPDWQGWPADPPFHLRRRVGAEWERRITCDNGHVTYANEYRLYEVAAQREP